MRPLVILDGLIQQLSDNDRLNVSRLNIGAFETVNVTGPVVAVTRSFVRLVAASPNTDVHTILGGQVGDVLFMFGTNIRFKTSGNLVVSNNYNLTNNDGLIWVYSGAKWLAFGD